MHTMGCIVSVFLAFVDEIVQKLLGIEQRITNEP